MPVDFDVRLWDGFADDQFIQLTEGVVASETLSRAESERASTTVEHVSPWHTVVEVVHDAFRAGIVLPASAHYIGLGARHGLVVDQAGRSLQLGADRAYTGPDCPPDMLEIGGIPQGDYAPVPWLLASAAGRRGSRPRASGCGSNSATEAVLVRARPGRCACTCSRIRRRSRDCARSCG